MLAILTIRGDGGEGICPAVLMRNLHEGVWREARRNIEQLSLFKSGCSACIVPAESQRLARGRDGRQSSNEHSSPFKVGREVRGWEGDGFKDVAKIYISKTHPHPNPPLEGGSRGFAMYASRLRTRSALQGVRWTAKLQRILLPFQGGGWEGDGFR
jgi:hypothetical protein